MQFTLEQIKDAMQDLDGFCIECGHQTCGGCEPDARKYTCEACGKDTVYGAEELVLMGYVS